MAIDLPLRELGAIDTTALREAILYVPPGLLAYGSSQGKSRPVSQRDAS